MTMAIPDQSVQSSQSARGKTFAHPRPAAAAHALIRRESKKPLLFSTLLHFIKLYYILWPPCVNQGCESRCNGSRRWLAPAGGVRPRGEGQDDPAHKAGSERPA